MSEHPNSVNVFRLSMRRNSGASKIEGTMLSLYDAGKRIGPRPIVTAESDSTGAVHNAVVKNIVWVVSHVSDTDS